jgi:hypothetical protein
MKKILLALASILMASGVCLAQSTPPSLAELAKQNKRQKKAVKVLTDEDLPARSSVVNDSTTPVVASAPGGGNTEAASTSANKKDQSKSANGSSKDQPAAAELKKKLETYQSERDSWKTSVQRYETLLANETNEFRRQTYENAIANDKSNVALYQQKIDQTQADLAKAQKGTSSGQGGSN